MEISKNRNGSRTVCVFKTHYGEPGVGTLEVQPYQLDRDFGRYGFIHPETAIRRNRNGSRVLWVFKSPLSRVLGLQGEPSQIHADPLFGPYEGTQTQTKNIKEAQPSSLSIRSELPTTTGIPVADFPSEPIKIVQAPRETMILYEVGNLHRQIFAAGRTLPKEFDLPAYWATQWRHWEGDTFVVETAGFNDKAALYGDGSISIANHCTSPNASTAAPSDIWIGK